MGFKTRLGFVKTGTIHGVEALPVIVEVSVSYGGLPGIHIVGMPDTAIKEATRRVRQALQSAHFEISNHYVVFNLAPSSLKKVGSGFDLPIALAYLVATGQINARLIADRLCVGELSLGGDVKAVTGQLAYEKLAQEQGLRLLTGPTEAGVFERQGLEHRCLENLAALKQSDSEGEGVFVEPWEAATSEMTNHTDYSDIAGNDLAKRALQIAAAGGHGLLLVGPPGSGKSMMAARLPSILPPLPEEERLGTAMIHSVAGLPTARILAGERPFRSPHHGASRAGLIGGGTPTGPGEVSLAHNGVLFLDELPEFGAAVLQLLRQPMEQGSVALARAGGTVTFPARFMFVAAANPCPCGFYGDPKHSCRCTPAQISRYQGKVGGPLMDRINLIVDVRRSDPSLVLDTGTGTSSAHLREGVLAAQAFALWRRARYAARDSGGAAPGAGAGAAECGTAGAGAGAAGSAAGVGAEAGASGAAFGTAGADATGAEADTGSTQVRIAQGAALLAACQLGTKERSWLELMSERYQLSGRGIMSALAVARTIADMEESEKVHQDHLLEAVSFRARDVT
ncbi:MAG: YifB family Mg chelatase-like AAA ATPase [Coriobacteriales bacterium]|jgi:magnesium chelatase family protein|nr:YifB family Mg chelatase-like AAA ATPase [Coriobacteriales bacterium]